MTLIPAKDVGRVILDSMQADLERQYGHPIDRQLATKVMFVTFGGILAGTETAHNRAVKEMFAELEKA